MAFKKHMTCKKKQLFRISAILGLVSLVMPVCQANVAAFNNPISNGIKEQAPLAKLRNDIRMPAGWLGSKITNPNAKVRKGRLFITGGAEAFPM